MLRNLGIGVVDDSGLGMIHQNEKAQALFLDTANLKVLEFIDKNIKTQKIPDKDEAESMQFYEKQQKLLDAKKTKRDYLRHVKFMDVIDAPDWFDWMVKLNNVGELFMPTPGGYVVSPIVFRDADSFGTYEAAEFIKTISSTIHKKIEELSDTFKLEDYIKVATLYRRNTVLWKDDKLTKAIRNFDDELTKIMILAEPSLKPFYLPDAIWRAINPNHSIVMSLLRKFDGNNLGISLKQH